MGKFNREDLIRFLYNETSAEKSAEIQTTLQVDEILKEEMEALQFTYDELNSVSFSPNSDTISKIMDYAARGVSSHI